MARSSSSDAGTHAALDALATVLGVKGQLRLVPQGSTPKPHVVIKRDYPKDDDDLNDMPSGVARFSFIAGKKFSVAKGQQLFFAVASPSDSDGKTLHFNDTTFLIEADVAHGLEENDVEEDDDEEETYQYRRKMQRVERDVEALPPKVRKNYTGQTTYESFASREPPSSLGFLGFPLGAPTPRVYSTVEVQTENVQPTPPITLETIPIFRDTTPCPSHVEKSPLQLPSPVSADHPLEPSSDDLVTLAGEETDAFSRAERSLSPMDLSSASASSLCSPVYKERLLPKEDPIIPTCDTKVTESGPTPPPEVIPQPPSVLSEAVVDSTAQFEPPKSQQPSELPPQEVLATSTSLRSLSPPPPPSQDNVELSAGPSNARESSESPPCTRPPTPPPSENGRGISSDASKASEEPPERTPEVLTQPDHAQELSIKKELVTEAEKALSMQNITSVPTPRPTPIMPRAMRASVNATPIMSEKGQGKAPAFAPGQDYLPTPLSMRISNGPSQSRSASPVPEPRQVAQIAPVSSSNPLGIRPSHVPHKAAPKAPRSLLASTSVGSGPKKPVVVGAKWSAARNAGNSTQALSSSGSSTSSLGSTSSSQSLSSSTSLSSLGSMSSVTSTSPVVPSAPAPAALSTLIPYASPSPPPPPPPELEPPPPPPPPSEPAATTTKGGSKWKRISSVDGQQPEATAKAAAQPTKASPVTETPSPTSPSVPAKRPLDLLEGAEDRQGPAKKARDSPPAPSAATASSSTAGTSSAKPQPSSSSTKGKSDPPAKSANSTQPTSSSSKKPQKQPALKPALQLLHPLPPKPAQPQLTGSSYRPSDSGSKKRSRSPEASSSESRRHPPPQPQSQQQTKKSSNWPATQPSYQFTIPGNVGVEKMVFSSNGRHFAVACADKTLRIFDSRQPTNELVRLAHERPLVSVCWMEGDNALLILTGDRLLASWTRNGKNFTFAKLQRITDLAFMETDRVIQMVHAKEWIAVIIPSGVRVWQLRERGGQKEVHHERDISWPDLTAIQFVQDGRGLVGGCHDGVLWYCDLHTGRRTVHSVLSQQAITSIEVHPSGQSLLVSQAGGKASLIPLKLDGTASAEKVYTNDKLQTMTPKRFPAVFATKGQAILYGAVNGCALVWDRKKGVIVYGLQHPDGDNVQAAATFDGRPGMEGVMITGTKQGRLFWWPQPVAAAPASTTTGGNNGDEPSRKRHRGGS